MPRAGGDKISGKNTLIALSFQSTPSTAIYWPGFSLRQGKPVLQQRFPADAEDPGDDQQHEPERKLLGQCCSKEFFGSLKTERVFFQVI
jgi:hypothetical protein